MNLVSGSQVSQSELPASIQGRLPTYGTIEVNTVNELMLKRTMTVFMIRKKKDDNKEGLGGWQPIGSTGGKKFYATLMGKGTHNIDGNAAMYLFGDVQHGIIFELIYTVCTKYLMRFRLDDK